MEVVNADVAQCNSSCGHRRTQKYQRWIQLLPPSRPLELVAINILGPLTKMREGNCASAIMRNQNSKLTRAILCAKVTAPIVVNRIFLKHWNASYNIPIPILLYSGTQFVSKCYAALCLSVGTKLFTTTEYHLQARGKVGFSKPLSHECDTILMCMKQSGNTYHN